MNPQSNILLRLLLIFSFSFFMGNTLPNVTLAGGPLSDPTKNKLSRDLDDKINVKDKIRASLKCSQAYQRYQDCIARDRAEQDWQRLEGAYWESFSIQIAAAFVSSACEDAVQEELERIGRERDEAFDLYQDKREVCPTILSKIALEQIVCDACNGVWPEAVTGPPFCVGSTVLDNTERP